MYPFALGWLLVWVFFRGLLCSSLLCHPNIRRVFRRLCLLLNICSFEGILDRNCPRITPFGPAAPSRYSRQGFGPSNYFFRASSAFKIFEAGLRSPELLLSGQQRLQDIRGRASVPRITSFGPAAPSRYSRQIFGPSNYSFRASSAFKILEVGLQSL
jgi:hypothetical protein